MLVRCRLTPRIWPVPVVLILCRCSGEFRAYFLALVGNADKVKFLTRALQAARGLLITQRKAIYRDQILRWLEAQRTNVKEIFQDLNKTRPRGMAIKSLHCFPLRPEFGKKVLAEGRGKRNGVGLGRIQFARRWPERSLLKKRGINSADTQQNHSGGHRKGPRERESRSRRLFVLIEAFPWHADKQVFSCSGTLRPIDLAGFDLATDKWS